MFAIRRLSLDCSGGLDERVIKEGPESRVIKVWINEKTGPRLRSEGGASSGYETGGWVLLPSPG